MPYTVDFESVNGGIYAMGKDQKFTTIADAQAAIRKETRGLDCYHQVFIADETGRRTLHGYRNGRTWQFDSVEPLTRVQLHDALVPIMGYEDTSYALVTIDECGEYPFDRHDAYGTLHYKARYFGDGAYALYKIP